MFLLITLFCLGESRRHHSLSRHVARAAVKTLKRQRHSTNDDNPGMLDLGEFDESKCQCYPCQAPMSPQQVTEMQGLQNKIYAQQAQLAQMTTLANKITESLKSKESKRARAPNRAEESDVELYDEDLDDEDLDLDLEEDFENGDRMRHRKHH